MDAARTLFLRKGHAGTTMEEIAAHAGITKRTLYNLFADKDALFTRIVAEVIAVAGAFARDLRDEFSALTTTAQVRTALDGLARRLALRVVSPDVVALRRLLIGEASAFPSLAEEYFDRAPRQVIEALADGFALLARRKLLRVPSPRRAASQFAYLAVGELLDRAMLVGSTPSRAQVLAWARDGVETFMARYGVRRS